MSNEELLTFDQLLTIADYAVSALVDMHDAISSFRTLDFQEIEELLYCVGKISEALHTDAIKSRGILEDAQYILKAMSEARNQKTSAATAARRSGEEKGDEPDAK
jgi:hypothetical protein